MTWQDAELAPANDYQEGLLLAAAARGIKIQQARYCPNAFRVGSEVFYGTAAVYGELVRVLGMSTPHRLERDANGVWQLTDFGRQWLDEQTIAHRGYIVRMGLMGEAFAYRAEEPERCIAVRQYWGSEAGLREWIDREVAA